MYADMPELYTKPSSLELTELESNLEKHCDLVIFRINSVAMASLLYGFAILSDAGKARPHNHWNMPLIFTL